MHLSVQPTNVPSVRVCVLVLLCMLPRIWVYSRARMRICRIWVLPRIWVCRFSSVGNRCQQENTEACFGLVGKMRVGVEGFLLCC